MKHASVIICAVASALISAASASAQPILPGGSQFNPPLPPAPPPPKIEVPVIPQLDAPVVRNYQPAPRPSFSDRINSCLDEAAARGVRPGARAAYSRACANR